MNLKRIFISVLSALTLGSSACATPIIVAVTPRGITVGTNQTDSTGRSQCKLLVSSTAMLVKAQDIARVVSVDGKLMAGSETEMWRALHGSHSRFTMEHEIVSSLEKYSVQIAILHQSGSFPEFTNDQILEKLRAHVLLVVIEKGVPKLSLLDITFHGWPTPQAHVLREPVESSRNFLFIWDKNAPGPFKLDPNGAESKVKDEIEKLLVIASQLPGTTKLSFAPPFEIVRATSQGFRRLLGSPALCLASEATYFRP